MSFDMEKRTIIFKEVDGEPVIAKVSEVDRLLANGYVEKFTEAKQINIKQIKRKLQELQAGVKELPKLPNCASEAKKVYQTSSDRLLETLRVLQARRLNGNSIKV